MEETAETPKKRSIQLPTDTKQIAQVAILGAVVGLLVQLQAYILSRFFIEPVFCRSTDSFAVCSNGGTVAYNAALIIISVVGVAALVKLNVFRPLLVALGAAAGLWSMNRFIGNVPVLEYSLWLSLLFSLSYVLFYWLMHLRNFLMSLGALIAAVVIIRVVLAV